jgi:hypothetical protein
LRRQTFHDCRKDPRKIVKQSMPGHVRRPKELVNLLGAKSMAEPIRLDRLIRAGTYFIATLLKAA